VPDSAARSPCVVFLHGFGGQLTAYLKSLHEGLGERFIIAAPFLDSTGAFWAPRGKEAVRALVTRHLPDQVDRDRVLLVGLSNGAVGATAIMQDPELSTHFRGFVLVSGIGAASAPSVRANVLVIAGADDERFPLLSMQRGAEALRRRGAQVKVVTLPADHFLLLSHAKEMAAAIDQWQW
jgi:predicted esterase